MKRLGLVDLSTAPRQLPQTFSLSLDDRTFDVERVLRWLPGKRLTAWVSPGHVLKLFIGDRADVRFHREMQGLEAYGRCNLQTPAVLDRADRWLLFEGLAGARHAEAGDIELLAGALATMHAQGYVHGDLHLGNFLMHADRLFLIDGDGIVHRHVSGAAGLGQLATLLAQFSLTDGDLQERALSGYGGGSAKDLNDLLRHAREKRIGHYLAKSRRNCTEFEVASLPTGRLSCRRQHRNVAQELVRNLPEVFSEPCEYLKRGGSATVVRTWLGGEPFVVKRYNIKSFGHRLRRTFKRRPRLAWENALTLEFMGIPTARAIALFETGPLWFPQEAYLLCRDLGDEDLESLTADGHLGAAYANQLAALLCALSRGELLHGDFKATNLILHQNRLHLIDTDGLRRGVRDTSSDAERLLANWPEGGAVRSTLSTAIVRSQKPKVSEV